VIVEVAVNEEHDEEPVEVLLVRLYPTLRRFAAVVAPPEVAPDDLVHDALVGEFHDLLDTALANPGS
jgi:hypothetical protein